MFFKIKKDRNIMVIKVDGGNRQRKFISKEDVSSLKVATEGVLLTCVIDVQHERYVAIIDMLIAFTQPKVEKEEDMVTIIVIADSVDVLLEIALEVYRSYNRNNKKGSNILILRYLNSIQIKMVAILLYY